MTADRPDPMELLGEMEPLEHADTCSSVLDPGTPCSYTCWKYKLPALRAAIEAGEKIRQAAVNYVAAQRALGETDALEETSDRLIELQANEDAAWTNLCVAVDGWTPTSKGGLT